MSDLKCVVIIVSLCVAGYLVWRDMRQQIERLEAETDRLTAGGGQNE